MLQPSPGAVLRRGARYLAIGMQWIELMRRNRPPLKKFSDTGLSSLQSFSVFFKLIFTLPPLIYQPFSANFKWSSTNLLWRIRSPPICGCSPPPWPGDALVSCHSKSETLVLLPDVADRNR